MNINLTLVGQIITFAIFVWFTFKFVWPPILKVMNERKLKINEGLNFAKKAVNDLEIAKKESNKIINNAKSEAIKIIEKAQMEALKINENAKDESRINAKKILDAADLKINQQIISCKNELKKEISNLAILTAEKIVNNENLEKLNQEMLAEIIEKI